MKQASFKIGEVNKLKNNVETEKVENKKTHVETNIVESNKNITSKKPIKRVENIYYFK